MHFWGMQEPGSQVLTLWILAVSLLDGAHAAAAARALPSVAILLDSAIFNLPVRPLLAALLWLVALELEGHGDKKRRLCATDLPVGVCSQEWNRQEPEKRDFGGDPAPWR